MKTIKTFIAVLLLLLIGINYGHAEVVIDSINYSIEIGDFMGQPNSIVRMPVKLKNQLPIGAFVMRMEFDTSFLTPVNIGFETDSFSWDSLELVDRGWNTIDIDSISNFPLRDTSYNVYIKRNKFSNSLRVNFMPMWGPHINVPVHYGPPATIFNILFHVKRDAPVEQTAYIYVKDDTSTIFHDVQLADTTGLFGVSPGNGPIFATATFFVEMPDCGDIYTDGNLNILDIVSLINYLYLGGSPSNPPEIADIDHSGIIDILDVMYYINFLYNSSLAPDCPM